jgi:uncharacterized protein (TIGR02452 family)
MYPTINDAPMYKYHQQEYGKNPAVKDLASDFLMVVRSILIFRDDSGAFLARPFAASFITACAPRADGCPDHRQLKSILNSRIRRILQVAIVKGFRSIVLGAFGCGKYRNDGAVVAGCFKEWLWDKGWASYFDSVVFAIFRSDPLVFSTFRDTFDGR